MMFTVMQYIFIIENEKNEKNERSLCYAFFFLNLFLANFIDRQ